MKKNGRFFVLPTINLKNVINVFCSLICTGAFIFACVNYLGENATPSFFSFILNWGINNEYKQEKNITEEMLSLSVPAVSLVKKAETVIEEPTSPSIPAPESLVYTAPPEIAVANLVSTETLSINNLSGKSFDKSSLINLETPFTISDEPQILILHTHTTESYLPSEKYPYTPSETGRTLDSNFNMISVGEVISQILTQNGINVIHDKTVNDYPSYSQSYSKSLRLASSYIQKYPSIKMVIDVHRDALGTGEKTLTTFDTSSSQVMLVVGTNASGLDHPNWETNLSFALKLHRHMNSVYPSLSRPINLRRERFNQHVAPYSFILEVGTNTNTLDEAKKAAEYFSLSLVSLLKN